MKNTYINIYESMLDIKMRQLRVDLKSVENKIRNSYLERNMIESSMYISELINGNRKFFIEFISEEIKEIKTLENEMNRRYKVKEVAQLEKLLYEYIYKELDTRLKIVDDFNKSCGLNMNIDCEEVWLDISRRINTNFKVLKLRNKSIKLKIETKLSIIAIVVSIVAIFVSAIFK
ncbi:hypothetical protein [Clostridium intestinale]|uniref:hypothetical protein n=1 Tax=Clostridium intestinale TaxID=36845 RepID=UPI0028EDC7D0|nr:hypothetical protein [Clostridium intestinale]